MQQRTLRHILCKKIIQNLPFGSFDWVAPANWKWMNDIFFSTVFFLFFLTFQFDWIVPKKNETTLISFSNSCFLKKCEVFPLNKTFFCRLSEYSSFCISFKTILCQTRCFCYKMFVLCIKVFLAPQNLLKNNDCGRPHKKRELRETCSIEGLIF